MSDTHVLTDEACDRLTAHTLDKLAKDISTRHAHMHAMDINTDIASNHTLRRALVRAAYAEALANVAQQEGSTQ